MKTIIEVILCNKTTVELIKYEDKTTNLFLA